MPMGVLQMGRKKRKLTKKTKGNKLKGKPESSNNVPATIISRRHSPSTCCDEPPDITSCDGSSNVTPVAGVCEGPTNAACDEQVAPLDLTVTYDYTCEGKNADPVKTMEELSGLFSFKDTLHLDSPVSLWGEFNSQPPLSKKTKTGCVPCHSENHNLKDLVTTIDQLKETDVCVNDGYKPMSGEAEHEDSSVISNYSMQHKPQERAEGDSMLQERAVKGVDYSVSQGRTMACSVLQAVVGDNYSVQHRKSVKGVDNSIQHRTHQKKEAEEPNEEPIESDSSEDGEFWEAAAALLSERIEEKLSQDNPGGLCTISQDRDCSTNILDDDVTSALVQSFVQEESSFASENRHVYSASSSPKNPNLNSRQYNSHQVELKRLKAIHLLSQKKKC